MGNRAVIKFKASPTIGFYVHWNGGPESIAAFVQATKDRGARSPENDPVYAIGAFASTLGLFFHSGRPGELLSYGIGTLDQLDCDNGDNGVYTIGEDWEVTSTDHSMELTDQEIETRDAIVKNILEQHAIVGKFEEYEALRTEAVVIRDLDKHGSPSTMLPKDVYENLDEALKAL